MRNLCMMIVGTATLAATPAVAGQQAGYYGPIGGLFSGVGFEEKALADGTVEISASSRARDGGGHALNTAMYRAAELARLRGHKYVQFLSGRGGENGLRDEHAVIVMRGSDSPDAPTGCRKACYTADVAELIRLLSGPSGNEPGVAFPTRTDEFGRQVTVTGFGIARAGAQPHHVPVPRPISGPGSDAWLRAKTGR